MAYSLLTLRAWRRGWGVLNRFVMNGLVLNWFVFMVSGFSLMMGSKFGNCYVGELKATSSKIENERTCRLNGTN
jgi:hypothetical protein